MGRPVLDLHTWRGEVSRVAHAASRIVIEQRASWMVRSMWIGALLTLGLVPVPIMATDDARIARRLPGTGDRASTGVRLPGLYDILGYRRRWWVLSYTARPYLSASTPILVGGCGRSGTTLLQAILSVHPQVAAGPESTVFLRRITTPDNLDRRFQFRLGTVEELQRRSRSQVEFIDLFGHQVVSLYGRSVWVEKTPKNVQRLDFVFRHFPRARFVHMLRDGRDVVCSLLEQP